MPTISPRSKVVLSALTAAMLTALAAPTSATPEVKDADADLWQATVLSFEASPELFEPVETLRLHGSAEMTFSASCTDAIASVNDGVIESTPPDACGGHSLGGEHIRSSLPDGWPLKRHHRTSGPLETPCETYIDLHGRFFTLAPIKLGSVAFGALCAPEVAFTTVFFDARFIGVGGSLAYPPTTGGINECFGDACEALGLNPVIYALRPRPFASVVGTVIEAGLFGARVGISQLGGRMP